MRKKIGFMFFFQSNSCAALFYAVRQFYAIAIFFMVSLDTYGVGQKLKLKVLNVYVCSHSS